MKQEWIEIGYAKAAHGLKGAFHAVCHGFFENILEESPIVRLFPYNKTSSLPADGRDFTLTDVRWTPKLIMTIKEISTLSDLEKLMPFSIRVTKENLEKLDGADALMVLNDLPGMKVFEHATGKEIGIVQGSYDNGAQVVVEVVLNDGRAFDIPFVEAFFPEVDWDNRRVNIVIPEYVIA
jgi:ribosomal 30S subunit maturation factor RimM